MAAGALCAPGGGGPAAHRPRRRDRADARAARGVLEDGRRRPHARPRARRRAAGRAARFLGPGRHHGPRPLDARHARAVQEDATRAAALRRAVRQARREDRGGNRHAPAVRRAGRQPAPRTRALRRQRPAARGRAPHGHPGRRRPARHPRPCGHHRRRHGRRLPPARWRPARGHSQYAEDRGGGEGRDCSRGSGLGARASPDREHRREGALGHSRTNGRSCGVFARSERSAKL